ncbi:MAG: HDIG domain-containing metalloprotein [Promethearchaeota archaeon]
MSLNLPHLQDAQNLLKRAVTDSQVLKHCQATRQKALKIARQVASKISVNFHLLELGALLHDIGRARTHDVTHGFVGGQILFEHGYPMSLVLIVERHVLGGFTALEAIALGLPRRDFLPQSWEEKIVCVADKLGVFEYDEIEYPKRWLPSLDSRFAELTRRYGVANPFLASMQRARNYTAELIALAIEE